jgi:ABC-type branched-subunit amino acid transport system substrate-binding protein
MGFKKIKILVMTLSAVLLLTVCAGNVYAAGDNVVKIGLVIPLSGLNADQGVFNRDGAQLAADAVRNCR